MLFNRTKQAGTIMQRQFISQADPPLDRTTAAAICNAIGERLRRDFKPHDFALPPRLQTLLDEMQRQDRENR